MPGTAVEIGRAATARDVHARGVSRAWAVAAVAFLVVSIVVGVLAGPVDISLVDAGRSLLARVGLADATPLDPTAETILDFEAKALKKAGVDFAPVPPRYRTTYFSHIMGGYSAGYYAYIWSEVLDATTVEWFKANNKPALAEMFPIWQKSLDEARTPPLIPQWIEVSNVIWPNIQAAIIGEKTPQQALDDAAAQATTIMQDAGLLQ